MNIKKILVTGAIALVTTFNYGTIQSQAYDKRTFKDGSLWNDPDYEYDWGTCFTIGDDSQLGHLSGNEFFYSSDDRDTVNAINANGLRFSHWCNKETDIQGWQAAGGWHWTYENEKFNNEKLSSWDIYWDCGIDKPNLPNTVFGKGRSKVLDASIYNKDGNYNPWGYSSNGRALWYGRWGVGYYKRIKPSAYQGTNYIQTPIGKNIYSEGTTLWTQSGSATFKTWGSDWYPNEYGQNAQNQAGIKGNCIGIYGNDINVSYKTNLNQGSNYFEEITPWSNKKSNSHKTNSIFMYGTDNFKFIDGLNRRISGTQMNATISDGYDYSMWGDSYNKWDKKANNLNGFTRTTSSNGITGFTGFMVNQDSTSGRRYTVMKVDDKAPTWNTKVDTTSPDSLKITLSNIEDHRGISNNISGVGFDNAIAYIYPKGHKELKNKVKLDYIPLRKTADITINYPLSQQKYFGDYVIELQVADHLFNTSYKTLTFRREDPKPLNSNLFINKYKYKDGDTYWVNTRENFQITTSVDSNFSYSKFPTQTVLLMGYGSSFSSNYNGFSAIATISGVDTTQNNEKNKYINTASSYKAIQSYSKGAKSLTSVHDLRATNSSANNRKYNLHTLGRTYSSSNKTWYNSVIYNSSSVLAVDGAAPTCTFNVGDRQNDTVTLEINNLSDNGGSGVKSLSVSVKNANGITKSYKPIKLNTSTYKVTFNRNDFKGAITGYSSILTMTDNVDNTTTKTLTNISMIQNNLTANIIKIYDPIEKRYVSQVISGYEYEAKVEIQNTGERAISNNFSVAFKIDGNFKEKQIITTGINKNEKKVLTFKFIAGAENLKGVNYSGIVDYDNNIFEINENDNECSTPKPYSSEPNIPEPPSNNPPVQTIVIDYEAKYINVTEEGTDTVVDELLTNDKYRLKFKIKNNSSYPLKYLDILNKSFISKLYYDNIEYGSFTINENNDIDVDKDKTFYSLITVPELNNNLVEDIKEIKGIVDVNNQIRETNENNNSITNRKKVLGLKVIDYRIDNIINPPNTYTYPIYTKNMPTSVISGYDVAFRCNVKGKADTVYAELKDSNGKTYDNQPLHKVKDIDNTTSEYEYTFNVPLDTPKDTIIFSKIYAAKGKCLYDYNLREKWNGKTLLIGGNAESDIIIFRQY